MRSIHPVRAHLGLVSSVLAVLAASSVGCETKVINIQIGASGSYVVTGTIGQNGGALSVDDPANPVYGTEIQVPAGAVSGNTEMTIQPADAPPAPPYGIRGVGPVVRIDFAPLTRSARLVLPYAIDARFDEQLVILRRVTGTTGTRGEGGGSSSGSWVTLPAKRVSDDSRRVEADTDDFGLFLVATIVTQTTPGTDGGPVGDGGPTSDLIGPTGPDQLPPVFGGLGAVKSIDPTHVRLSWKPATDNVSPSSEIRYRLYVPSFGTVGTPKGETRPGETSFELAVTPGVTYYFLVRAIDRAGNEDSNLQVKNLVIPPLVPDAGPSDGTDQGDGIGPDGDAPDGQVLLALGASCSGAAQCQSGFCADGVCCDGACTGSCSYCKLLGREGRCLAAPVGTDPRSECQTPTAGRTLLCGQDRTCSLCRATTGTEICNNGVDDNGDQIVDGDDPSCAVCIDRPSTFTVEVASVGTGAGRVTSSPPGIDCGQTCRASFADGASVVLTAAPDATSTFTGWAGDCAGQPGTTCTVTADRARTVTAGFMLRPTPQVSLAVTVTGQGTVNGSLGRINCHNGQGSCTADYDVGTPFTLTATPDAGHYFVGWQGACLGASTCQLNITSSAAVTAQFAPIIHVVTVLNSGNGSGTVTDGAGSINCGAAGATCGANFLDGAQVTLTATPAAHSRFTGWSGACSGTQPCTFTISGSVVVIANFVPIQHVVTVAASGSGSVTDRTNQLSCTAQGGVCSASFDESSSVTLFANPAQGAFFSRWDGACAGSGRICVRTVNAPFSTTAVFLPVQHQLSVSLLGTGAGQVSDSGPILCGKGQTRCSADYNQGTLVTLTASASPGSTFTSWSGSCSGTGACVVAMDAARDVGATFTRITRNLTVSVNGTGTGSVTGNPGGISCNASGGTCQATVDQGTQVNLTANPGAGSIFTGWSGAPGCEGNTCQVTVSNDLTVSATFVPRTHNVSVSVGGHASGTVSDGGSINCGQQCSGTFNEGSQITLTATPAQGAFFTGWSGTPTPSGAGCAGTTGTCVVTVNGATSVTANFEPLTRTLTIQNDDQPGVIFDDTQAIACGGRQSLCGATYTFGQVVTLSASPNEGFEFVGWGGDCSGTDDCVVTMDADRTVSATFQSQFVTLSVSVVGPGFVSDDVENIFCTNDGGTCFASYLRGTQVPLFAQPFFKTNANFIGWSGACSGDQECVVTMDSDRSVVAVFEFPPPPPTHTVSVTVNGPGSVGDNTQSIFCDAAGGNCVGSYNDGDLVFLFANTDQNSFFVGWGGACASFGSETTCSISLFSDVTVSADFQGIPQ